LPIDDCQLPIEKSAKFFNWKSAIGNWQSPGSFLVRFARSGAKRAALITLAELSARSALQSTLIGAQTSAPIDRKHALNLGVRPWNNVNTDQLADPPGRSRARIRRRFHRADVTAHEDRHVACSDVLLAEQLYIRCFDHRIGGLNCTHESFGLNHSECFQGHLFVLTFVYCRD
jgi:hypothetical protein